MGYLVVGIRRSVRATCREITTSRGRTAQFLLSRLANSALGMSAFVEKKKPEWSHE